MDKSKIKLNNDLEKNMDGGRQLWSSHPFHFQGDQYWLLNENLVVEPGFPKPLASEFPGLTGSITAALAVAATRSKPEALYFFKSGEEDRHTHDLHTAYVSVWTDESLCIF